MAHRKPTLSEFIIQKAMRDPDFRKRLLGAPRAAIEAVMGEPIPEDVKIQVFEDTPNKVHLVLPLEPASTRRLKEAELASLTGGGADATPVPNWTFHPACLVKKDK